MPPGTLNNVSTFEDLLPTNDVVWDDVDDAADVRCFFLVFVAAAVVVVVVEEEEEEEEEEAAAVGARLFCFCRFFCTAGGSAPGIANDTDSNWTLTGREQVVNVWTTWATDAILTPLTTERQAPTGTLALLSAAQA